jgi:hypothetical protein
MLNEQQRRTAVPRLLDFAADHSLDRQTRGWVFQALRDITGQALPPMPERGDTGTRSPAPDNSGGRTRR